MLYDWRILKLYVVCVQYRQTSLLRGLYWLILMQSQFVEEKDSGMAAIWEDAAKEFQERSNGVHGENAECPQPSGKETALPL